MATKRYTTELPEHFEVTTTTTHRRGRPPEYVECHAQAAEHVQAALRILTPVLQDDAGETAELTGMERAARTGLAMKHMQDALRLLEGLGAPTRP